MDPKDSNSHYNSEIYMTWETHISGPKHCSSTILGGKWASWPPCPYDGVAPLFICELETPGKEIKKFPRRIDKWLYILPAEKKKKNYICG